jgi:type I restriction enzyme S subunit
MKYPAYPEYKPLDISWLENMPIHWEVRKLRYFASSVSTGTTPSSNESQYFFEPTETWYTPSDFDDSSLKLKKSNRLLNKLAITEGIVKLFPMNSVLVVGIGATLGRVGVAKESFSCNQQINVIVPNERLNADFLAYSLQVKNEIMKVISNATTLGIMNQDKTKLVEICAPDIEEQEQIAAFLDYKTDQIERLIEKKKALTQKLNEKRLALITQAVTKGLNLNVPMKPSCVDWLGEVPAHWDIRKLKFSVDLINNKIEAKNTDLPYLGLENIESFTAKKIYVEENPPVSDGVGSHYKYRDVLFGKLRPYLAKAYLAEEEGFCSTEILVLQSIEFIPEYLIYFMLGDGFIKQVNSSTYGSKMPRANWEYIGSLPCPIPPKEEQIHIVDFIKEKTDEIDSMLRVNNQTIERLTEYRTALITAAVTGKIDVRGVDIPDQEAA